MAIRPDEQVIRQVHRAKALVEQDQKQADEKAQGRLHRKSRIRSPMPMRIKMAPML